MTLLAETKTNRDLNTMLYLNMLQLIIATSERAIVVTKHITERRL